MSYEENKAKAQMIARGYKCPTSSREAEIACEAALEMAEWKDKVLKSYLETRLRQCCNHAKAVGAYDLNTASKMELSAETIRLIIDDLYGKE